VINCFVDIGGNNDHHCLNFISYSLHSYDTKEFCSHKWS